MISYPEWKAQVERQERIRKFAVVLRPALAIVALVVLAARHF